MTKPIPYFLKQTASSSDKQSVMRLLKSMIFLIPFISLAVASGCGGSGGDGNGTGPAIVTTSPADGAVNVAVSASIQATFNEMMDPASLTPATFFLTDSKNNLVRGTVSCTGATATFSPSEILDYSETYTATVTSEAMELEGNSTGIEVTWSFTTEAMTTSPPTSGSLDTSFNKGGFVYTDLGAWESAKDVSIQSDGKIVVVGRVPINSRNHGEDFTVIRYNTDGSLDPEFGGTGVVFSDIAGQDDVSTGVVILPDGKIIVGGYSVGVDGAVVMRYNADGSLDPTFGTGETITWPTGSTGYYTLPLGIAVAQIGSGATFNSLVLQPDGKIVVGGMGLVRFNSDGTRDASFGTSGIVSPIAGIGSVDAIALQPDGKIVGVGKYYNGSDPADFGLVRYNSDGSLDTSFGINGYVITPVGSAEDINHALAIQADGKILTVGRSATGSYDNIAVLRYNSDGTLDPSFGLGGIVTTYVGIGDAYDVAFQPDGRIVVGGYDTLVRYNSYGTLDTSFGTGGIARTAGNVKALALQADGKIVSAGDTWITGDHSFGYFVVARYWP